MYRSSHGSQFVGFLRKQPAKKVSHFKGFYRCCIPKWQKHRREQQWSLICQASPTLARRFKEVPDVLRKMLGKSKKFHTRKPHGNPTADSTSLIPFELEQVVSATMASWVASWTLRPCGFNKKFWTVRG